MPLMPTPRHLLSAAVLALAACSSVDGAARAAGPGRPFDLKPGASATLAGGGTLRYLALVDDSRCRPDVQCIWAGDAEIALEWSAGGTAPARFNLHVQPASSRHALDAGRQLHLIALGRGAAPVATLQVDAAP
ncbi:MAG: hypothetical protein HOQ02_11570 [Lysobacter sp.]|nr:hypothetical protein [Lysobacter sp.]